MKKISRWLLRATAIAILATVYSAAWLLSRVLKRRGQGSRRPSGCILAIGTFHNPNWIQSHIRPLARSGVGEVILVWFVGGSDIMREMYQSGELQKLLEGLRQQA